MALPTIVGTLFEGQVVYSAGRRGTVVRRMLSGGYWWYLVRWDGDDRDAGPYMPCSLHVPVGGAHMKDEIRNGDRR